MVIRIRIRGRKTVQTKRKSNIELIRVISMLLIITLHFTGHCVDVTEFEYFSPIYYFGWLIRGIGYISVNCYVLIGAYFLCENVGLNIKKLFALIFETFFYSVGIYVLLVITKQVDFSVLSLIKSIIPILSGEYWFVTVYFGLYLLSPFLNWAIRKMTKREHFNLCASLILLFSVIPTFVFFSKWLNYGSGYGIVWFIVLYFIASYIKKYTDLEKLKNNRNKIWLITLVLWLTPLLSKVLIAIITHFFTGRVIGSSIFYNNISVIILMSSVVTFLAFISVDINNPTVEKIVLFFGRCTFGVYLIHDNNHVRNLLWGTLREYVGTSLVTYIGSYFVIVFSIFICCSLIDYLRQKLFMLLRSFNFTKRIDSFFNREFSNFIMKVWK